MVGALPGAAVLAFLALGVAAQKPDFSGTWTAKALALNAAGVTGGSVIRIEQTAETIRIRRSYGRESMTTPPVTLTIRLDGSESPNPYRAAHREGLSGAITSRATWDGNRLVIVTTRTMTDAFKKTTTRTETTETFSLDGTRLIVEVISPGNARARRDIWFRQ